MKQSSMFSTLSKLPVFFLFTALMMPAILSAADSPRNLLQSKLDRAREIIDTMPAEYTEKQEEETKEKIRNEIQPLFDEEKAAELSISPVYWKNFNQANRKEYSDLLRQIILKKFSGVYSKEKEKRSKTDQLKELKSRMVSITGDKETDDAIFEMKAIQKVDALVPGDELDIPLSFMFYRKGEDWRIYDIHFDGKSLIFTYRKQFGVIIKKYGVNGLLTRLRKLVK